MVKFCVCTYKYNIVHFKWIVFLWILKTNANIPYFIAFSHSPVIAHFLSFVLDMP